MNNDRGHIVHNNLYYIVSKILFDAYVMRLNRSKSQLTHYTTQFKK